MSLPVLCITSCYRPILPDYYLDFGYVVYGNVLRKTLSLTNVRDLPCTVTVGRRALARTGFSVDLSDKIKALPEGERVECVVTLTLLHCTALQRRPWQCSHCRSVS